MGLPANMTSGPTGTARAKYVRRTARGTAVTQPVRIEREQHQVARAGRDHCGTSDWPEPDGFVSGGWDLQGAQIR